jgi:hypothetical protein
MKAQIIEAVKTFQPVTLELTFESQAEIDALEALMSAEDDELMDIASRNATQDQSFSINDMIEVSCSILQQLNHDMH